MNRQTALLLVIWACVAACSGPGLLGSGDRTLVRLYDAHTGVRIELANQSHPDYRDVYSRPRAEAALKLAPDELMDALLERLDDLDFEELSKPGAPSQGADVLGWLEVVQDTEARTFAVPRAGATREQLSRFAQMQYAVSDAYTHVTGLQFIDNPEGAELFRRQQGGARP